MSTDGHGLWASLPDELTHKIVEYVGMYWDLASWVPDEGSLKRTSACNVLECRRLNRAFAAALWPVALCQVPMTHTDHAKCFVEGVVRHVIQGTMAGDRLGELYTIAYLGCTRPGGAVLGPRDQSGSYYDQLAHKLGPTLQKLLGDRRLSHQEKRVAVGRMRFIFTYLDRVFVQKGNGIKSVRKLIAEAFGYQEEGEARAEPADSSDEDEEASSSDDSSDEDEEASLDDFNLLDGDYDEESWQEEAAELQA